MHECKYGNMLKQMCDDAMTAAFKNNNMREFDHVLQHLCAAVALLFAAIEPESRVKGLLYIVNKTDEAEKMIEERVNMLKEAIGTLPDDAQISPEIRAKAEEVFKNMQQPKH